MPVLAMWDICSGNGPVLPDGESMLATAVLTDRNIPWPKGPFPLPDSPFPVARDSMERQRGPIPLALSKRKSPSGKQNGAFWHQRLSEARWMQGQRSSFNRLLTIDDDTRTLLGSLRHCRRRGLRFKPPFDSHGANRQRAERQPPWFLLAEWYEMFQRSRESAV